MKMLGLPAAVVSGMSIDPIALYVASVNMNLLVEGLRLSLSGVLNGFVLLP